LQSRLGEAEYEHGICMTPANAIELDTLHYITLHPFNSMLLVLRGNRQTLTDDSPEHIAVPHTFVTHPSMFQ
jgi:hypothetical protein